MEIAGFIPLDFTVWRGHAACVLMTPKCNFRCPYCNHPFLVETPKMLEWEDPDEILDEIHKNLDGLTAVVISGGEPTLQHDLQKFCKKLRGTGLDIMLETNGSRPALLEKLIKGRLVDYVAMDIKAPLSQYVKVTKAGHADIDNVAVSKDILLHGDGKIDYEFRTTFIPDVVTEKDLDMIVWDLQDAKRYVLQQFDPETCIDDAFEKKPMLTFRQLKEIAENLKFNGELIVRTEDKEEIINE